LKKGKIVGLANAGKLNVYFERLQHKIFLVMDFMVFNMVPRTKKNIEFHLYKNFSEVYEYFQNIDITDPNDVIKYAEGFKKSPEEWLAEHQQSTELEKQLGIYRPINLIEAIDFFKFPSVDSTVKTIIKSYAESLNHNDLSISLLTTKLLEDCVKHAKTMTTYKERGYTLSTLKKFVKKTRALAICLKNEGYKIDSEIQNYKLDAGKRKSPITFNLSEKQNVWALKREEYEMIKNLKITNKTLRTTRDMFMVQVEAGGLRVNELFKINKDSIHEVNSEHILVLEAGKTKKIMNYTIKPHTYETLKSYNFNMHQFEHEQTYNKYLRKLAEKATLNREVIQMRGDIKTDKIVSKVYPIHELFSSKAARKAFISILYNDGVPVDKIARITRHSTDSINHYISVLENVDKKTIESI
jgi:hypothetical protein